MSTPLCAALSPAGYACTLDRGHGGDYHEARKASGRAHAFALGPVVARWPQEASDSLAQERSDFLADVELCFASLAANPEALASYHRETQSLDGTVGDGLASVFEAECQAALDADDRAAYEAVQRGDAAPEEVEARRRQMRVVPDPTPGLFPKDESENRVRFVGDSMWGRTPDGFTIGDDEEPQG